MPRVARLLLRMFFVSVITAAGTRSAISEAEKVCPDKPGLYAMKGGLWTEIPQESTPVVVTKMGGLFGYTLDKEFAGNSAFTTLANPVQLCAVGTTNATFSLERAKVKKKLRTIVQTGNYHEKKTDQSQAMAILLDEQGNAHLMTRSLDKGQYIIVMHGVFTPPHKATTTGSPGADALNAATATSMAMAQSIAAGTQGLNFGFGID